MPIFDSLEKCWEAVAHNCVQYNLRSIPVAISFLCPQGIMLWAARAAHWTLHNSTLPGDVPTFDMFLTIWTRTVQVVASWEPLGHYSAVFLQFHSSLSHLLYHGSLISHAIAYQLDQLLVEERHEAKGRKVTRKQELASEALELIRKQKSEGCLMVYTDGSAAYVPTVGWVGG